MLNIAIVTGSTRPGRQSLNVANWVQQQASQLDDNHYEVLDIADFDLPIWSEPLPPMMQKYSLESTKKWADAISRFDAYIFVTGEYNHSISGALKNALDHLHFEFKDKAAGFVSYGSAGGTRAVMHLREILSELEVAHVRNALALNVMHYFPNRGPFVPDESANRQLEAMLKQLTAWSRAMKTLR